METGRIGTSNGEVAMLRRDNGEDNREEDEEMEREKRREVRVAPRKQTCV